MARREYFYTPQCAHEGCGERANYVDTTRRDHQETVRDVHRRGGWRCVRHTNPDSVLSEEVPERKSVLVSYEESYGRFWGPEGSTSGGSGFNYGPGFKAYANDFPAGTRLIVTARVELPDSNAPRERQRDE